VTKTVYLDQNKWIDLSRARHGEDGGATFDAALKAATEAVEKGTAMFPLSVAHYFETWKRYKGDPRRRVGGVMSDLSRHRTIAGQQPLTQMEVDVALFKRFGTPDPPRTVEVFGYGAAHAFDKPALAEYANWPAPAGPDSQILAETMERELISGPVEDLPIAELARPDLTAAQNYAASENEQTARFVAADSNGDEIDRTIAAAEVLSLCAVTVPALKRAGVSVEQFLALGQDGLTAFMLSMPRRGAAMQLRQRRFRELHQKWKPNDLNDIAYLSLSLAYCDVLVTERQWTHRMRQAKLDEQYGTVVIADLRELPDHL
jgi:hypothetical protein